MYLLDNTISGKKVGLKSGRYGKVSVHAKFPLYIMLLASLCNRHSVNRTRNSRNHSHNIL